LQKLQGLQCFSCAIRRTGGFMKCTLLLVFFSLNLQAQVILKKVFSNHTFEKPLYLVPYPGNSTDLVIVEQPGQVSLVTETQKKSLLNLSSKISIEGGEDGLLGLAFSPNFKKDREVFVYYTQNNPFRSRLSRFKVEKSDTVNILNEEILMEFAQPFLNHNGGMLTFGPDGLLYLGLGDGGSAGDPQKHAQNLKSHLGKILRIKIEPKGYSIPEDNPFKNSPGVKPEIYAYGLRNPWRFSFIPGTNQIIVGDVGQNAFEEVSIVESGDNMGWSIFEGNSLFQNAKAPANFKHKAPLFTLKRNESLSITGGYVYKGNSIPELKGKYIFGDFAFGTVWSYDFESKERLKIAQSAALASFAEDASGELYIVSLGGEIFKFTQN
jgi:glucose/arabinose dehydrogenase